MPPTESSTCAVCEVPAKQYCSACKSVKYCCTDHQRQHWKQHKLECRPYRISKDQELGRFLQTTRSIKQGNVIFTEAPLVVGPKWYLTEHEEQVPVMPCVGCYTPCRMGIYHCPKCRWPTCTPNCTGLENPNLHGLECSILMLGPGPTSNTDVKALIDYYRSDALVVLKCLLLQRQNPKKWTELMDMQSHEKERVGSELHKDAERRIVSYLQNNFLTRLHTFEINCKEKFLKEYDTKVLHRICGIIETNFMCINLPTGMELSGLYYTGCMMEHDCQPNCYFQFDHRNGFKISVVAGRDIGKNEHLKLMYSNMLWGTQLRQEHLAMTKHFLCKCARCADVTECDTYFSALRCMGDTHECLGWQLPKEPLNVKTEWRCSDCQIFLSGEEIRYLLTQMSDEVESLLARKPTIKQLETLIQKLSKFLHPNHYHLFSLQHSLIQLYGTESGYTLSKLTEEQLQRKYLMCIGLYDVCQKLDPFTIRLSIYMGSILYEMHTVLVERGKRLLTNDDKKLEQALTAYKEAHDHLLKAAKVLEKEIDTVAGNRLTDAVVKAINHLEFLIENHRPQFKYHKP